MIIKHVIPQIGIKELTLYEPAKEVYLLLKEKREHKRLNKLRHLGPYAYAVQGARLARWDYTVTMIYYANNFKLRGMNGNFRIGEIPFSSGISALQSISLIWNIGHLPGTFGVEKGICRYLFELNSKTPIQSLNWRFSDTGQVKKIIKEANNLFLSEGYLSISRILSIFKLLTYVNSKTDDFFNFIVQFAAPFLLEYDEPFSLQWHKLRSAFKIVRHLAYLTIDTPISGIQWAPNIPSLVESLLSNENITIDDFGDKISEILSPFERSIYEEIYHRHDTRKEAAILANSVYNRLSSEGIELIEDWLQAGLKRELKLGKILDRSRLYIAASIKLRSHFIPNTKVYSKLENSLRKRKFQFPAIFEYKAWNSDIMIEPDEIIIDVMSKTPNTQEVGRLIYWLIKNFDNINTKIDEPFELLRKESLLNSYKILLSRAVEIKFGKVFVKITPWNFKRMGLFSKMPSHRQVSVWASDSTLDDFFTKHLVRKRKDSMELRDEYQEILGIRALRKKLIKEQRSKKSRNKYLVVAGSVTFYRKDRDLIEYDGGLLKISPKNGYLTWYGLETKRGRINPERCLRKKLAVLEVQGKIIRLSSKHAYVELRL